MRENPENKGFTNGKYYYYQTTNGNWDLGPGIDKAKQTDAFNKRAVRGFTAQWKSTGDVFFVS